MSNNHRFTAEMLRPYEYIFKNEMHPEVLTTNLLDDIEFTGNYMIIDNNDTAYYTI